MNKRLCQKCGAEEGTCEHPFTVEIKFDMDPEYEESRRGHRFILGAIDARSSSGPEMSDKEAALHLILAALKLGNLGSPEVTVPEEEEI